MGSHANFKQHWAPPFRAEHIGSLLRDDKLLELRAAVDEGKANKEDLEKLEDTEIKNIVKAQLDIGFHGITDGEYRRHMFFSYFWENLEGIKEIRIETPDIFRMYVPDIAAFTESGFKPAESVICVGKIKHKGSVYVKDFKYLASLVPEERVKEIKVTLAVPTWYHLRYKQGRAYPNDVYANDDEYFADVAKAFAAELDELYKAGCRNVQFDDPNLAYFCSEKMIEGWKQDPTNIYTTDELLAKYIDLYNACVKDAPSDLHIGLHLCRGNFVKSRHFAEGSYDRIAIQLFQQLNVHTYYLEYDTPRAGGFEPLVHLPKNKNVILGVVTSKFPEMEDPEEMKARVMKAVEYIQKGSGESKEQALSRVGVSPQCGFASHSHGNSLGREDMIAKLKLVRKIADDIWPGQA